MRKHFLKAINFSTRREGFMCQLHDEPLNKYLKELNDEFKSHKNAFGFLVLQLSFVPLLVTPRGNMFSWFSWLQTTLITGFLPRFLVYPFIPFGRLVMKRHHYPLIPCTPSSGKSRSGIYIYCIF